MAARILIVIPSRLQCGADGKPFVQRALSSIVRQKISVDVAINVCVGVDPGQPTSHLDTPAFVRFAPSHQASQAAALNAGAQAADHDFLAFLEDDDIWSPMFLDVALRALDVADFVSSTQLEVDSTGMVVGINDFPTPSGWIMRRRVWEAVGGFDESFRFHLDNDWLGRLAEAQVSRLHLVESTAPLLGPVIAKNRPQLHLVLAHGGPGVRLRRHKHPVPLIRRLVHEGSGMGQIRNSAAAFAVSQAEHERLISRYGRIPR